MDGTLAPTSIQACPGCGVGDTVLFYEQAGVPAHDCRLYDTRAAALCAPRGDLELSLCRGCGLIVNSAFDEAFVDYSGGYEDTQAFSPRFRRFAYDLAAGLVARHELRGRKVLEIGCGKGDFLEILCELGVGHCVGVDPALVPERLRPEFRDRITAVCDTFPGAEIDTDSSAVVCRHTLEHVRAVSYFLEALRSSLRACADAVVMFEVPDVSRVLLEGAFWDFYYEHCTYFAPGSLAGLFRRAGFEPTRLERVYDDQYIVIEARADDASTASREQLRIDEPPAGLTPLVSGFRLRARDQQQRFLRRIEAVRRDGGAVALWGSSSKTVSFLTTLGLSADDVAVVDVNPYRHGKFMPGSGHEILAPERLVQVAPRLVVAMNPIYQDEIRADLHRLRLGADVVSV